MIAFIACALALAAPEPVVLELRPELPAVAAPAVPALWEGVPDGDTTPGAGEMTPDIAYQWLCGPGGSVGLRVVVEVRSACDRAVLTVWDWHIRPVRQVSVPVPADRSITARITGKGAYLLTLDGFAGSACRWRRVRSLAACADNAGKRAAWASSKFQVGLCTFPGRQSWPNEYGPAHPPGLTPERSWRLDAEMTARTGVQLVRPDIPLVGEEGANAWLDTALLDAYAAECAKSGIKLDLQIGAPPPVLAKYASVTDPSWRYPRAEEPYRRYVRALVSRYGRFARFIEVWNEPDNLDFWRGTPEEFVTQHRWALEEIRAAECKLPVAPGGYCMVKPEWTPIMAGPIGKMTDWLTYHSHGDLTAMRKMLADIRRVTAEAGAIKRDVVNTEMGWACWRLDMERMQAATGMQKLLECWAEGHRAALLYCARDVGGPRMRKDPDWGFVDYTFCPRFAYAALCGFIETFAGARFERALLKDAEVTSYAFRRGGETLVTLSTPFNPVRVELTGQWRSAVLVDAMGNRTPLASRGPLELEAGAYPVAVVMQGAGGLRIVRVAASAGPG